MNALRFLVCFFIFAAITSMPIEAQEIPLTQFYAPDDAHVALYYPSDWEATFSHSLIVLSNNWRALSWYTSIPLMPGQVVIVMQDPVQVAEEMGTTIEAVSDALAEQTPMLERETVTVHEREAVRLVESDSHLHVVFSLSDDQVTYATLVTRAGERGDFEAIFFDILEQSAGVEVEPVRRGNLRDATSSIVLDETFDGSFFIPVTFNYPSDWFVIENRSEGTAVLSNKDISRRAPNDATLVVYMTPFPLQIADPAAELDWVMNRYWYYDPYGESDVMHGDNMVGVYGILYGDDRARDEADYAYTFTADLIFENGTVWFTAVGYQARDYAEDEAIIFQILNSAHISD